MANRFLSNIRINDAYTFPASDGTNGQVIGTDGAGNLSFVNVESEAGATVIYRDNFSGDNTTTTFTLGHVVSDEVITQVYIDGVYQSKDTYITSGDQLTFSTAPQTGVEIEVITFNTVSTQGIIAYNAKNSTGSTIAAGTAVMAVGTDGNSGHILIAPMVADGSIEPKYFMGVTADEVLNGGYVDVVHFGVIGKINTSSFSDGDVLWLDPANNGGFTVTEPNAPNIKMAAAIVLNSSTNGKIFVRVQGNEGLHELHDVHIENLANQDILVYNTTQGYWENSKTLGDITTGNITTAGTVDGVDISAFKAAYDVHTHVEGDITDFGNYLTNITHDTVNNKLVVTTRDAATFDVDLSQYIDDTNLARLTSGSLDAGTGIATFTRDDATTFTVDFSALFDDTDTNDFLTGASFNTADGVLTLNVSNQTDVTVDLDGRYLESYTETDTLATVTGRGATTSSPITIENNSLQNLDFTISNTQGNTTDRVRILTEAGGQSWDIENDQNLDVFKIRDSNADTDVFILTNGAPSNSLVVSSSGDISTVGSVTASGTITSGSITTIKGSSPYIQWKNSSDTRLGYIQHNETDLVMSVDTGNIVLDGLVRMNRDGQSGNVIEIDHVEDSNWPFVFKTSSVGNDNHSGFWVNGDGTPDMRLRATDGSVKAIIHSNGTSYIAGGNLLVGTADNLTSQALQVNGFVDITNLDAALRFYNGSSFRGGFGDGQWATGNSSYTNDLSIITTNRFIIQTGGSNDPRVLIDSNGLARFNNGIRLPDTDGTVDSLWGIYGWGSQLQFTKRNLSTDGYEGTAMFLDYGGLYAQSDYSFRAPVFYDSNSTSYYVDPSTTSWSFYGAGGGRFRNIQISSSDLTDTIQNVTSGGNLWLQYGHNGTIGLGYGGGLTTVYGGLNSTSGKNGRQGEFRNTRTGDGTTNTNTPPFLFVSNNGDQAWGIISEFRTDGSNTGNDRPSIKFSSGKTTTNWTVGYGYNDNNFRINQDHGLYDDGTDNGWGSNRFLIDTSGNVFSQISSRAPIFYDSNNTAWYTDPASRSILNTLQLGSDSSDTTNLKLDVQGNMAIRGTNGLYYGVTTNNYNSWTTRMFASGSTQYFNGQQFIFDNQGYGSTIFATINSQGVSANVFRDSADTNYYLDPASDSRLNNIVDARYNTFSAYRHSGSDFTSGTLVATDIPATATNGASFVIEVTGKSYTTNVPPFSFMAQGYLYNNTIISTSGVNNGDLRLTYIKVMELNGYLHFWWPRVSYWNSFEVRVRDAGGSPVNRATNVTNNVDPSGATKKVQINLAKSVLYDFNTNSGDLYGAIYYDANDTSYYLNPNGYSKVDTLGATNGNDAQGISFRGSHEVISGEGWCTAHYAYNNNDGFLFLNRDTTAGTARPVFHIGGKNNASYAGYGANDSIITLAMSDGVKNTGSTYAGRALSNTSYYTNIIKTSNRTIFNDAQGEHKFNGRVGIATDGESTVGLKIQGGSNGGLALKLLGGGYASTMAIETPTYGSGISFTHTGSFNVNFASFKYGANAVGYIQVTSTSTVYSTSSDYRLKENIVPMTGALDRVSLLKPSRFNFIGDDKIVDGFIAHEAQEVVPEAVTGEKDGVDYNGDPEYQGIDQSKLVPLLVGAIQELKAEVEALKQKLNGTN